MFCFKQTSPKFDEDEFLENDQMKKNVYCELKFKRKKKGLVQLEFSFVETKAS